jgi:hypothetical protein
MARMRARWFVVAFEQCEDCASLSRRAWSPAGAQQSKLCQHVWFCMCGGQQALPGGKHAAEPCQVGSGFRWSPQRVQRHSHVTVGAFVAAHGMAHARGPTRRDGRSRPQVHQLGRIVVGPQKLATHRRPLLSMLLLIVAALYCVCHAAAGGPLARIGVWWRADLVTSVCRNFQAIPWRMLPLLLHRPFGQRSFARIRGGPGSAPAAR